MLFACSVIFFFFLIYVGLVGGGRGRVQREKGEGTVTKMCFEVNLGTIHMRLGQVNTIDGGRGGVQTW